MNYNIKEKELELLNQLKIARVSSGFSQRGLCAIVGMQQPSLVKIENGSISPQLNTILKLLEPLGLTLSISQMEQK